jgi:hypothetical protein
MASDLELVVDDSNVIELHDSDVGGTAAAGAASSASAAAASAADAAADAAAAHTDRLQTDADAAATAADRTAVHTDRLAADADKTATAADRVQTGLDRTQTGSDRTQTGLDRTQTGLDRTQTGIDAANAHTDRLAADTSAANAHTSELNAAGSANAVNGLLNLNVAAADVTLDATQSGNGIMEFTGVLTGNRIVTVQNTPHPFIAKNLCTNSGSNAFTLTIKSVGQTPSVTLVSGKPASLFCDGTGVYATTSTPGLGYSSMTTAAVDTTLDLTNVGGLFIQTGVNKVTTLPPANTIPAGLGVTVQLGASGDSVALQSGNTAAGWTAPYTGVVGDTLSFVSDASNVWRIHIYSNKARPKFDTSVNAPVLLAGTIADNGTDKVLAAGPVGASGAGGVLRTIGAAAAAAAQLFSTALGIDLVTGDASPIRFNINGTVRGVLNAAGRWLLGAGATDDTINTLQVKGGIGLADSGVTFADGSKQTTAYGLTQATSVRYLVGATDTVGSFAAGDTSLRTGGFVAPYVEILRNGDELYQGIHYTLNADGIHINGLDPLLADEDLLIKTKFPYNPSTVYQPALQPVAATVGASSIAYPHVQGFAYLLSSVGGFLIPGSDYTDDANGFNLLNGVTVGQGEQYAVLNISPVTLVNMLASTNPTLAAGVLTFADGSQQNSSALPEGQCYLSLSGSTLVLTPRDGNKLNIAGKLYKIPAAGVTLAAAGAVANTTYYIYAYMAANVMTLEYSTTGHSQDANTGVEIKTGDSSRTLVGMGRATATASFTAPNASTVTCISWFNRRRRVVTNLTNNLSLGAGPASIFAGVTTLSWADDTVQTHGWGTAYGSTVSTATTYMARGASAITVQGSTSFFQASANQLVDTRGPIQGDEAFTSYNHYMGINAGTVTGPSIAAEVAFMG